MNPIALYLASGESLYAGTALMLVLIAWRPWVRNRWLRRGHALLVWVALAMVGMACAPVGWGWYAVLLVLVVLWWMGWEMRFAEAPRWRGARVAAGAALALVLVLICGMEAPWRARPQVVGARAKKMAVIGDSISSGIGTAEKAWPELLQGRTRTEVRNLAFPGDMAADAVGRAGKISADEMLVVIEIGGNDLISGTPTEVFARNLERLLAACSVPGRTVVMFELPMLPHRIGYGRVQRELAAKYHVQLVPKRYLVEVLAGPATTLDGLHLSGAGAERMAAMMRDLLEPVLEK
ncbi:MAG TPA: GDSL-type esterase/lipase family protein [Phycisphaerae bacterium]|nr:GDSL-type esterase/lipase family protein [Phycisphaerae bacterium]